MLDQSILSERHGSHGPSWHLTLEKDLKFSAEDTKRCPITINPSSQHPEGFYYLTDGFLDPEGCDRLSEAFSRQETHPVGVDGYSDTKVPSGIGSYRANAWAPKLAEQISVHFRRMLNIDDLYLRVREQSKPVFTNRNGEQMGAPLDYSRFQLIGSTPFMRFMRYPGGGKHVPHYDASFIAPTGTYVTLMSWVLYLNTPPGRGGEFQFIDDGQWATHPIDRDRSDWRTMAPAEKVVASIAPLAGRLLTFPHWLPHQVALYENPGPGWRKIIRGDVAYACA